MMTKALAANGAKKVYIIGRRKEVLEEAASHNPSVIIPVVGDVTSKDTLKAIASRVQSETGHINLLVCNSGAMGPSAGVNNREVSIAEYAAAAMNQSWEDVTSTLDINVTAVLFTAYAFLELLDKGNKNPVAAKTKSQILITGSIAGFSKQPNQSMAYKASKAAVMHLAKNLSSELWPFDIRCNALAPGCEFTFLLRLDGFHADELPTIVFPSDLASSLISNSKADPREEGSFEKSYIPAERTGDEEDMAGTVLYIASRAGAYLNGNILMIVSLYTLSLGILKH
jgi:NAD(P)-dependent dehydrogenase (short-subunit alcohol dehydrogenase family)